VLHATSCAGRNASTACQGFNWNVSWAVRDDSWIFPYKLRNDIVIGRPIDERNPSGPSSMAKIHLVEPEMSVDERDSSAFEDLKRACHCGRSRRKCGRCLVLRLCHCLRPDHWTDFFGLACLHLALASQPPLRSLNRFGPAALHRSFLSSFDYLLYPFRNFLQPL
jgi:hypothetical protein